MKKATAILALLLAPGFVWAYWGPGGMADGMGVGSGMVPSTGYDDPHSNSLAFWNPMENDRGTMPDESPAAGSALIVLTPFNYTNVYYTLDDNAGYINYGVLSQVGDVSNATLSCWVRFKDTGQQEFLKQHEDTDHRFYINYISQYNTFGIDDDIGPNGYTYSTQNYLTINNWYHIVGVWDSSQGTEKHKARIYVNGVDINAAVLDTFPPTTHTPTQAMYTGAVYGQAPCSHLDINEARVYSRSLTSNEVGTLYAATRTNAADNTISTNNLVAYYPMDQDDNVRDYGTNGVSGVMASWANGVWTIIGTNSIVGVNNGRVEHAEEGDGVDDYIATAAEVTIATQNITIAAWIYWHGSSGNTDDDVIFYNGTIASSGYGLTLEQSDSFNLYVVAGGVANVDTGWTPDSNTWTHVAATRAAGDWTVYTNGYSQGTGTAAPLEPSGKTTIFADEGGNGFFDGLIDDVAIWTCVKDATAILALVDGTQKPNSSDQNGYNYADDK